MTKEAFVFTDRAPARTCPVCQRVLNAATGVSLDPGDPQPRPKPDDVTTCAYCCTMLVYTTDGLRVATDADIARLPPELQQLVLAYIAEHRPRRPD